MAKQFFIQAQSPSIELPVKSFKDSSGQEFTISVGFKRYPLDAAKKMIDSFEGKPDEETKGIIKSEILYIKNASLKAYDTETLEEVDSLVVADTRKAEPVETLWGDSKECLSVLVEHYLNSSPWRVPLIQAFIESLHNLDFKEAETKNS